MFLRLLQIGLCNLMEYSLLNNVQEMIWYKMYGDLLIYVLEVDRDHRFEISRKCEFSFLQNYRLDNKGWHKSINTNQITFVPLSDL